jgi:hypothetical protein
MRSGVEVSARFAVSAIVALTITGGVCPRAVHAGGPPGADAAPGAGEPVTSAPTDAPTAQPGVAPVTTTLRVPAGHGGPSVPVTLATTPLTKGVRSGTQAPASERRGPLAPLAFLVPFAAFTHRPKLSGPAVSHELPRSAVRAPSIPVREAGKREEAIERVTMAGTWTTGARTTAFPEEVVLRAMATRQPQFTRCWDRAQLSDTVPSSNKVNLHLELDAAGKITAVSAATDSPKLAACLTGNARQLSFPSPGKPSAIDVPLMFR